MSLRVCLGCSTRYAVGLQACPQCGAPTRDAVYNWEDDVAKAGPQGATYYLPEGWPVPTDLPDGVRLVGPGAPQPPPEPEPEPKAEPTVPADIAPSKPPALARASRGKR